ncbi:MAG: hypothetical protein QOD72_9, partial [Acidimicrobiaceae bacterium]|nr:hypothetical protein [Acidimicrobiaceae bacterium]
HDRCRTTDAAARTGDDDFVIFLAEADARGAAMVAARIRHDLRDLGIVDSRVTMASRPPRVTLQSALRAAETDVSGLEPESTAGHLAR